MARLVTDLATSIRIGARDSRLLGKLTGQHEDNREATEKERQTAIRCWAKVVMKDDRQVQEVNWRGNSLLQVYGYLNLWVINPLKGNKERELVYPSHSVTLSLVARVDHLHM